MIRKLIIGISLIAVALAGGGALHQAVFFNPEKSFEGTLAEILPTEVHGWQSYDRPLAETEEQRRNVDAILQYTDALVREYRKGPFRFEVYVAYWAPKTMPVRMVQAHTPDVCWVRGGGWLVDVDAKRSGVPLEVEGETLKLAEYRRMVGSRNQSQVAHVYYWHVVGDHIYITDAMGTWDRWDPVKSLFRFGLNQKTEQFFVRISSDVPFVQLWDDPGVREIMAVLKDLALHEASDAAVAVAPDA